MADRPLHCWHEGPDGASTCMLPLGHIGPHVFTPDSQITVAFREEGSVMTDPRAGLDIWTVYDHPADYPGEFVARRFRHGQPLRGPCDLIRSDTLGGLRSVLASMGLTPFARDASDDPKIVETWL